MTGTKTFPRIRSVGLDGALVTFADTMTEASNRAAIAFRNAVETLNWDGVIETSASLASTYLRFDPQVLPHEDVLERLTQMLERQDWYGAPLPKGRKLWHVPTVYGTDLAPQLDEAAYAAGLSPEEAIHRLSQSRVRVLTIGFAPGQPYLGPLGPEFNIPRQKELTPMVPRGALVLAISQFVLFAGPTPTGWRHVGQTGFQCFRPDHADSFSLDPGDEVIFTSVTRDEYDALQTDAMGGAVFEEITS
ncbi:allophanate hydrolase subunit 1 [Ruegeria sp. HKCCD7255]|uniref:5-oxoprolinase subunit B family protein n=1 Tax=Ruegeria sp. HKCCD7255 TaxID=2683004 RepID=UPI0014898A89|nr:carboxyltransferase domain-containing protein [Ruegeria sp. HKCCD7255]